MTAAEITSRNVKRYLRALARRAALRTAYAEAEIELIRAEAALTGGQKGQAERILKAGDNPYRYAVTAREPVSRPVVDHDAVCSPGCDCEEAVR